MKKYEAMFILSPDLSDEDKKNLFNQISDAVTKNNGEVAQAAVWQERKKLYFPMRKSKEGIYYLMNFSIEPGSIAKINNTYKLNENILRVLITSKE